MQQGYSVVFTGESLLPPSIGSGKGPQLSPENEKSPSPTPYPFPVPSPTQSHTEIYWDWHSGQIFKRVGVRGALTVT